MKDKKALIFDIQKFCVNDGPGIRTTVFFKGCPLSCKWCHNPESHRTTKQLAYYTEKCKYCRACESVCNCHSFSDDLHKVNLKKCVSCGNCVNVCNYSALEIIGREISVNELIAEVLRDKTFYEVSGGGLTVSGGEPLIQSEAVINLLQLAKQNGISTAVETCGFVSKEVLIQVAKFTDVFLYDFKESCDKKHIEYTGVSNKNIIENLKTLDGLNCNIVLRCPIIPGFNDRKDHYEQIAFLASSLKNLTAVEIMPYHSLGNSKYNSIGKQNSLLNVSDMSSSKKEKIVKFLTDKLQKVSNKNIVVK